MRSPPFFPHNPSVIALALVLTLVTETQGAPPPTSTNTASVTSPPSTWLTTAEVTYQANHDPSVIRLADGRLLQVVFGKLTWQEVDTWEVGRPLRLAYSEDRGAILIDPKSGVELPVIGGFGDRHPLDGLCAQELARDQTTVGMVQAYRNSTEKWLKEIERLYLVLLSSDVLPEAEVALRASRQAWLDGRRAHVEAAGALWGRPRGTIWQISAASHFHGLTRNHAFFLMDLVEPAMAGSEP